MEQQNTSGLPAHSLALERARSQLEEWYRNTGAGRRLREQISTDMGVILDEWFGYHMLVVGADPDIDVSSMTRVQTITRISPEVSHPSPKEMGDQPAAKSRGEVTLVALDEELPVATESVDVVVLINALELSENPRQLLREAHRVLTPHGHLLVVGSNQFSPLGLWRRLRSLMPNRKRTATVGPSARKLDDWLTLLDFFVAPVRHKLVLPLGGGGRMGQWFARLDHWLVDHNIPPGSSFVMFANKTVRGHIQGVQTSRTRARLMGLPVAKPVVGARGSASRSSRNHLRPVD